MVIGNSTLNTNLLPKLKKSLLKKLARFKAYPKNNNSKSGITALNANKKTENKAVTSLFIVSQNL